MRKKCGMLFSFISRFILKYDLFLIPGVLLYLLKPNKSLSFVSFPHPQCGIFANPEAKGLHHPQS